MAEWISRASRRQAKAAGLQVLQLLVRVDQVTPRVVRLAQVVTRAAIRTHVRACRLRRAEREAKGLVHFAQVSYRPGRLKSKTKQLSRRAVVLMRKKEKQSQELQADRVRVPVGVKKKWWRLLRLNSGSAKWFFNRRRKKARSTA